MMNDSTIVMTTDNLQIPLLCFIYIYMKQSKRICKLSLYA